MEPLFTEREQQAKRHENLTYGMCDYRSKVITFAESAIFVLKTAGKSSG